jgi:hypothetical protein
MSDTRKKPECCGPCVAEVCDPNCEHIPELNEWEKERDNVEEKK